MFYKLGKFVYRRKWWVIGVWVVAILAALPFVPRVVEPLKIGGFSDPSLESSQGSTTLAQDLGYSTSSLVLVFKSGNSGLLANNPAFLQQANETLTSIKNFKIKNRVVSFADNPRQISADGKTAYAVVFLDSDAEAAAKSIKEFEAKIKKPSSIELLIGGGPAFYADVEKVSQEDLGRAEIVAFPIAVVALLFVFGSVVAALLPVMVGGAGVLIILALIFAIGSATELSIFTVNLATLLGLGLGLDYSLFCTSRYREEIERGRNVQEAVAVTMATAGQAVTYSGLTVLIGLCALLTFKINLLVSIGIGGILVVLVSVTAAITLLPAILSVVGTRINALSVRHLFRRQAASGQAEHEGGWARLSHFVMRRPIGVFIVTFALLLLLGAPFLNVRFNSPDASILPTSIESRQVFDSLKTDFNENETNPILVAVKTQNKSSVYDPANIYYLYDFAQNVQKDARVERVDSIVSVDPRLTKLQYQAYYSRPQDIQDPYISQFNSQFVRGDTTLISIVSKFPSNSDETRRLVEKLRNSSIGNGITFQVTGGTAGIIDVVDGLYSAFPLAALFIVITTYVVLLVLFRSVVLPLKAILMNALSIIASYGMLVWVFQEGNLSNLFNFKALGFIEPTLPIIMFCSLFGLSMDYEVFLLSRIKEHFDHTGNNTQAVAIGMQRSGKIITSAALIVVLVSVSFITADIVLVKAFGLGVAVAVIVDATIVRALLVPATMRLLGNWNWYAPKWLLKVLPQTHLEGSEDYQVAGVGGQVSAEPEEAVGKR